MKTYSVRRAATASGGDPSARAQSKAVFRWLVVIGAACIVLEGVVAARFLLRAGDEPATPRVTRHVQAARRSDESEIKRSSYQPPISDFTTTPERAAREEPPPVSEDAPPSSNPFPAEERPDTTPEQMRTEVATRLRSSGPAGPWSLPASSIFSNWKKKAAPELAQKVQADPVQCFHTGCFSTVTYSDLQTYQQFEQSFTTSEAFYTWPGMKHRTAPDPQKSGEVVVAWVFFSPDFDPSAGH